MKYIIIEGKPIGDQKYHALGKARSDVNVILAENNFEPMFIHTENGVKKEKYKKPLQYYQYLKNYLKWKNEIKKLQTNENDWFLIQYPLMNNCLFFPKLLKKLSKKVHTIVLIHDLDSIRFMNAHNKSFLYKKRVRSEDMKVGKYATYIVSHNESMTNELIKMGVKKEKIVNLHLFDYLSDNKKNARVGYEYNVVVAGNLLLKKAKYLSELKNISKTKFDLYGVNYDQSCTGKNINYKGAFLPDELIENLKGSYGLVWDGDSINKCDGMWGNYLRYNNPHKISLYLAAGLPVIVWKESALSNYIEKNRLGFAVNSLEEIHDKMKKITKKEYKEMCDNVSKVSKKLKNGYFLTSAINKIIKK